MSEERVVDIFVRDRTGRLIPGASISFTADGVPAGGVPHGDGRARITLPNRKIALAVSVTYDGVTKTAKLGQDQDSYTFTYDVDLNPEWRDKVEKHLPLIVGLFLFAIAAVLAFSFGTPTALQSRIILGFFSLGGGAIATELTGMINVNLKLGEKLAIGATGALGIFVILYLVLPA